MMHCLSVVLLSVGVGIAASIVVIALTMPVVPHPTGGPLRRTPEEDRMVLEPCVAFYGVAYATGRWLYRRMGAWDEWREGADASAQHVPFLHLMGPPYTWSAWSCPRPGRAGATEPTGSVWGSAWRCWPWPCEGGSPRSGATDRLG